MAQPKKENVPNTPLGKMYEEHIGFIRAHNVDGLLNQYADNCLLISTMTPDQRPLYVRGHAELEKFFRERIFGLAKLEVELAQWAETPDRLMIVENITAETTDGQPLNCRFYDNWYLVNGKIDTHFAGVVQYPDGSFAGDTITVP
jgi:ketosteroid isomerase-like protein